MSKETSQGGSPEASTPGRHGSQLLGFLKRNRYKAGLGGLVLLFGLGLCFADVLLAGPLRNWAERMMNARLNGYTVHIHRARPHFWRLGFDLENVVLLQDTHPDPPLADFGALKFSTLFGELLRFRLAGDLTLDRPALHIDLGQLQAEARSHVSLKDRGWQRAVESVFPIKFNQVQILDGSLVYLGSDAGSKPLRLTKVSMFARNVRNIAAAKGTYPSPVLLEGLLFDTGKLGFKGAANFLREPHPAAQGEIRLDLVPLDRLSPIARDYQLKTEGGLLSLGGVIEYTPEGQQAHLREVLLEHLRVDYITSRATETLEREHGRQALRLARRVRDAPRLLLQVDTLRLTDSQIGFVNKSSKVPYRLFISDVSLDVKNLSNRSSQGRSRFQVQGAFMGHGTAAVAGGGRLTAHPVDMDFHLELMNAKLQDLNAFLNAQAGVDVARGTLSVFSEFKVKNGRVEGYIKPLIKDLKIFDKVKDRGKPLQKRLELHALQFMAYLFRNRSTKEVAAVVRISGPTKDPTASEWEVLRRLLGNGFLHAVQPGFLDAPKPARASNAGSEPLRSTP